MLTIIRMPEGTQPDNVPVCLQWQAGLPGTWWKAHSVTQATVLTLTLDRWSSLLKQGRRRRGRQRAWALRPWAVRVYIQYQQTGVLISGLTPRRLGYRKCPALSFQMQTGQALSLQVSGDFVWSLLNQGEASTCDLFWDTARKPSSQSAFPLSSINGGF